MLKPLIWNTSDKYEEEDYWPKKIIGATLNYLEEQNILIIIGGNFNVIENLKANLKINSDILKGIDENIEDFFKLVKEKIDYINKTVYSSDIKNIEVLCYDFKDYKWEKKVLLGKIPSARSFHKSLYLGKY